MITYDFGYWKNTIFPIIFNPDKVNYIKSTKFVGFLQQHIQVEFKTIEDELMFRLQFGKGIE